MIEKDIFQTFITKFKDNENIRKTFNPANIFVNRSNKLFSYNSFPFLIIHLLNIKDNWIGLPKQKNSEITIEIDIFTENNFESLKKLLDLQGIIKNVIEQDLILDNKSLLITINNTSFKNLSEVETTDILVATVNFTIISQIFTGGTR